jgi:uncharacterized protein YqjF (DUF2071 family)
MISLSLRNLLFVLHAVPPERLQPHIPRGLELDIRETPAGPSAFVAIVSVESGAAFPYLLTGFRQVNFRAYVRHHKQPGVFFLRSWVSSRSAAAAMSLAIPTEHADIEVKLSAGEKPYRPYTLSARSGEHEVDFTAVEDEAAPIGPFESRDEAVAFFTHRLAGFTRTKDTVSIVRVSHPLMDPLTARIESAREDFWVEHGVLKPEEAMHPAAVFIQPEIKFEMNLPQKLPRES